MYKYDVLMTCRRFILCLTLLSCEVLVIHAQDIHWSQFGFSPMQVNPALTGIFRGDVRFSGNYRAQWVQVPVNYQTVGFGVDQVIYLKGIPNGRMAAGLLLNVDQAGDSELQYVQVAANGSYTIQLGQRHFLGAGIQIGVLQRSLSFGNLTFDQQYNGQVYDPSLPSGEQFDGNASGFRPDVGVGVNYRYQIPKRRTTLDAGLGVFHLTEPDLSFFNQGYAPVERRFSWYGLLTTKITSGVDVLGNAMWQMQGRSDEIVASAGVRLHINTTHTREVALDLLFGYRTFDNEDALFPMCVVHYRAYRFGLSYDATLSEFTVANRGRGGPEFSFSYIFSKVRPLPLKICPIF